MENLAESITYEQALWDKNHIESLYPVLSGLIHDDGEWHDFPSLPESIGKYRVYDKRYFQAAYTRSHNSLFDETAYLAPINSEDDAEWLLSKEDEGYTLTSKFAVSPSLQDYSGVYDWLVRHGLVLIPHDHYIQGIAYFAELNADYLLDATKRLTWLENVILELNQRLKQVSLAFWNEIKKESDDVLKKYHETDWSTELVPVSEKHQQKGSKRRIPAKIKNEVNS